MPSIDAGAELVYFGIGRPNVPNNRMQQFPDSFSSALARAIQKSSNKDYHTAMSNMIGHVLHAPEDRLTPDEHAVRHILGGYDALVSDIAYHHEIGSRNEDMTDMALINQTLALDFFRIQDGRAPAGVKEAAQFAVSAMDALAQEKIQFGRYAMVVLNGARSQAVAMHTFKDHGYEIVVPDTKSRSDVKLWDIIGGVDFIAVGREPETGRTTVHMIDTVGRKFSGNFTYVENNRVVVESLKKPSTGSALGLAHERIFDDTMTLLKQNGKLEKGWGTNVRHTWQKIAIPTSGEYMNMDGSFRALGLTRQLIAGIQKTP